jgi:predicted P-loop ATPase
VDGDIDFETPVQHDQVFAQLLQEIRQGERYWLNKDEERRLMEHNLQYQRLNGLGEMLMAVIQKPHLDEEGEWITLKDLSALLKQHFKGYKEDAGSFHKIGNYLNRPEYKFQSKRVTSGTIYWVKRII